MSRSGLVAILIGLASCWGLTLPLTKIAVSEGYEPLGLIFWQLVIGAALLFVLRVAQGKSVALPLRHLALFLLIAVLGTVLPNSFSYRAAVHLPAGVMSVVLSLVPILSFPIALALGVDRFAWLRLFGILLGLAGVVLLAGPESLPEAGMALWLPVALIAPLCYAFEGNIVAKWGTQGLEPGHVLYGASVVGAVLALPLALWSGQWIDPRTEWNAPEFALVLSSIAHIVAYVGYVWLLGQGGAVFASQVGYVVTGTGVIWAMLLLGERYSLWVWAAMGLILLGMTFVRPRQKDRSGQNAALAQ